jgi:anti-sigma factor RsiW
MTHEKASLLLSEYVDRHLDSATSRDIERHLATCTSCKQSMKELTALTDAVRKVGDYQLPSMFAPNTLRVIRLRDQEDKLWFDASAFARRLVFGLGAISVFVIGGSALSQQGGDLYMEGYFTSDKDSLFQQSLLAQETISKEDVLMAAFTK